MHHVACNKADLSYLIQTSLTWWLRREHRICALSHSRNSKFCWTYSQVNSANLISHRYLSPNEEGPSGRKWIPYSPFYQVRTQFVNCPFVCLLVILKWYRIRYFISTLYAHPFISSHGKVRNVFWLMEMCFYQFVPNVTNGPPSTPGFPRELEQLCPRYRVPRHEVRSFSLIVGRVLTKRLFGGREEDLARWQNSRRSLRHLPFTASGTGGLK